jgi:hypothetical protein
LGEEGWDAGGFAVDWEGCGVGFIKNKVETQRNPGVTKLVRRKEETARVLIRCLTDSVAVLC